MKTYYRNKDGACSEEIKRLRKAMSLTQAGLASRLGVSWRTVAAWEGGNSYPRAGHLKALIALAIQQQAFAVGREAEEIRILWQVAHQKILLDEPWLCALLDQRSGLQGQALRLHVEPEALEETTTTAPTSTTDATPPLLGESLPPTPSQTNADQPQSSLDKTRRRHQWLIGILITLVILVIIGSLGTLFFQARQAATAQSYPSYLSRNGTQAFFDPLNQASRSKWSSLSNNTGRQCQFTGGAYHVSEQQMGYLNACLAQGIFSNFAFEVQLTIMQGDCGGMTFRDDHNGNFYDFLICQDGSYFVVKYSALFERKYLQSSGSTAIHAGLGQQNKMAIVASGSALTFYVNEQQIDQEQDSSYTSGLIALLANPYLDGGHATEVAYSNARLWNL